MKPRLLLLPLTIVAVSLNTDWESDLCVMAANDDTTPAIVHPTGFVHPYISEDTMPISAFLPFSRGHLNAKNDLQSTINRSGFRLYKEAGFNIVVPSFEKMNPSDERYVRKEIELCKEFRLGYMPNDPSFNGFGAIPEGTDQDYYEKFYQSRFYFDQEPVIGVQGIDEPKRPSYEHMGLCTKALKNITPNRVFFSTLFPFGAPELGYGEDDKIICWEFYERYINDYVNIVKPDILAYDQYLWHLPTTANKGLGAVDLHLGSLSRYSRVSKKAGIPFWGTLIGSKTYAREQYSEAEHWWALNTYLAYGAKGIQYYTYLPVVEGYSPDWTEELRRAGIVSPNGMPLDNYYRIKRMNEHIHLVDDVLMPASHKGVMTFGDYVPPLMPEDLLEKFGPLLSIEGGNALVGCFELNGKPVYYVMNDSIDDGGPINRQVGITTYKLQFKEKANVRIKNINIGTKEYNNVYACGFNLSGGEAMLVEVL